MANGKYTPPKPATEPLSICVCGCTGDGPNSDHEDNYIKSGHGACKKHPHCTKFRWKEFTDYGIKRVRMAQASRNMAG